jgi:NitT/TauT family transport system substrate-binding protein
MMTRLSRRALVAGAATVAIPLAMPHVARAADALTMRTDFFPWGLHAALHLCNVNGWFKDAGLEVDVQDGRGSANTLQLVNAGQVDVGQIQVGLISQAYGSGARLKCIADFVRATDLAAMVPKDSPMTGPADFKGKTLVCFGASPWAPFIDLWLKKGGMSRDTVNILMVDPAALFGTYTAGRVDGLLSIIASALPVAQKARPSKAIMASDVGIKFPSYGFVATESVLASKQPGLKRLVQVQQHAWAYMLDGHVDEAVAATLKQRPDARLDPEIIKSQLEICLTLLDTPSTKGKPLGWQSKTDWENCLTTQLDAAVIKPGLNLDDFFTNEMIA